MNPRSLLVGVAVLLAALLAWWAFVQSSPAPPPVGPRAAVVDAAHAVASSAAAAERQPGDDEPLTEVTTESEREEVVVPSQSWMARFLVVDDEDHPVANAAVMVSALWTSGSTIVFLPNDGSSPSLQKPPLLKLHTDAQGRTQAELTDDYFNVEAQKDGFRSSGRTVNKNDAARDVRLVLGAAVSMPGIVLDSVGRPAAGAEVLVDSLGVYAQAAAVTPIRRGTVGNDGRFALPALRGATYLVRATLDGDSTFPVRVFATTGMPDVVLRFPGGITLGGIVLGTDGRPAAMAKVFVRETRAGALGMAPAHEHVRTGVDGRFSIPVRDYARYQVMASNTGSASSRPVWMQTSPGLPHAEAQLQLLALATIRGRVVRDDSAPCTSMSVTAQPENAADFEGIAWEVEERYTRMNDTNAAQDGTFELMVHPDTPWTVSAGRKLSAPYVQQTGVSPGGADVLLRVTAAHAAGCVVHGTVVRSDGEPAADYTVTLVVYENGRVVSRSGVRPHADGRVFTLPPLPLGRQFAVCVSMDRKGPMAPTQTAPFVTDRGELWLDLRLEPWAALPVRLLDAAGAPAKRVRVVANGVVHMGFAHQPELIRPNGCAFLQRLAPGAHVVRVFDDEGPLCSQKVDVTPGLNPELVVRVPAR